MIYRNAGKKNGAEPRCLMYRIGCFHYEYRMKRTKHSFILHKFEKKSMFCRIIPCLLALLMPLAWTTYASEVSLFRHLSTRNGLPDNNIRCVTMLPDGLVCIQTATALSLYNGATSEIYRYNLSELPYSEYNGMSKLVFDGKENILWCRNQNNVWVFDMDKRVFEYDISDRLESCGLPVGGLAGVFIHSFGDRWFIINDGSIWISPSDGGPVRRKVLPSGMRGPLQVEEYGHKVWILSLNGMLTQYDCLMDEFTMPSRIGAGSVPGASSRFEMEVAGDGTVWIMFDKNLYTFDPETERIIEADFIHLSEYDLLTSIEIDEDGKLWIGTARSGLSVYNQSDGSYESFPYIECINGNKIYPHTDISDIYADDYGGIWVATQTEGLAYGDESIIHLNTINSQTISSGMMRDESVKCILPSDDGGILFGTVKGLMKYDPLHNSVTVPYPELSRELCISLYRDSRSRLWVGTFYDGVFCIDENGIRQFSYPEMGSMEVSYQESTPNKNCVRCIMEDSNGVFWISVYGGVGRLNPDTGEIELMRDKHSGLDKYMIVRDICQLGDDIAMAGGDNGSYLFSLSDGSPIIDVANGSDDHICNQIIKDSRGLVWIAENEGLKVISPDGSSSFVTGKGMTSLAMDKLNNVWAASFNEIYRIRVSEKTGGQYDFSLTGYGEGEGVNVGSFSQNASVATDDGMLYFGGSAGICTANTNSMFLENHDVPPYVFSFQVNGKERKLDNGSIVLKNDESALTMLFTNLNYANPSMSSYRYKLEPLDKEWQEINSQALGQARYTYVPPGQYVFTVMSAYNGTDWNTVPTTIDIVIRPPFLKSTGAYVLYAVLSVALAVLVFLWQLSKVRKRNAERNEREERRRKDELDQMKFRFFTNISHELRTPLSLILLPLEKLIREESDSAKVSRLETMRTNANELLNLVNHLLDFRRIEMGGEKMHLAKGNVGEFVEVSANAFMDAMSKKGITLEVDNALSRSIMAFDSSQMRKIINNLLSNAMKFTKPGGYVNVRLYNDPEDKFCMVVSDTGEGIEKQDMDKIFDRFYRSKLSEGQPGTGIGLSIVKQYVEMHNGSISVRSERGKGTSFTVTFPTDLLPENGSEAGVVDSAARTSQEVPPGDGECRTKLLVVDDNAEFRNYLYEDLSHRYEVFTAEDGKDCMKKIHEVQPDIVICDVMMPNMDGFEVTKAVKTSINTSHIPVILLTARASDDFRLEGYETGADAYLTKPFQMEILEARIRNLIDERQKRIAYFSKTVEVSPKEITITSMDQKLMTRIMECIEKNMDNAGYSVENLSADVGMHRMNLYRKIQSLTNMAPLEFMRTMRLKRAAQIIAGDPNLNVSEVAMMVGFNTTKYFSKYFKEMFGVTPSQYASQNK